MKFEDRPVRVYLILGSNMGDRRRNLGIALSLIVTELAPYLFSDVRESDIIQTEPWGFECDTPFLNQAVTFETTCPPEALLDVCKYVEHKMGREDDGPQYLPDGRRKYFPRIIDIDIVLYGDRHIDTSRLKIPHPQLKEREYAGKLVGQLLLRD